MKNLIALFVVLFSLCAYAAFSQEKIALGAPVAQPTISELTPGNLYIQPQLVAGVNGAPISQAPRSVITVIRTDGKGEVFEYPCTNGCTAMDTPAKVQTVIAALNTMNLSTRSLWRRVFDRLVIDFPERFSGGGTVQ